MADWGEEANLFLNFPQREKRCAFTEEAGEKSEFKFAAVFN
jgi:hypothetical protein